MGSTEAVIINERDCETEDWSKLGRSNVTWKTLLSSDRTPTDSITMGVAEIKPGQPNELHLHRHEAAESYYILSGEGFVSIDGHETNVSTGSAVFVPSNALHAVGNNGTDTLRVLYVFGVSSFKDIEYIFPS